MESPLPAGKRREEGKGEMQREVSMNPEGKLTGGYGMEVWRREGSEEWEGHLRGKGKERAEQRARQA